MVKIKGRKYSVLDLRAAADDIAEGVRDELRGAAESEHGHLYLWGRSNARRLVEKRSVIWVSNVDAEEAIKATNP